MADLYRMIDEAVTLRNDSILCEAEQCSSINHLITLETSQLKTLHQKLIDMENELDLAKRNLRTDHHNQSLHQKVAVLKNNVEFIDMTIVRKQNYIDLLSEMLTDKQTAQISTITECSLIKMKTI